MDNIKQVRMINEVSDIILEVADSAGEMTRGDLQGFAEAQAQKIINLIKEGK